MNTYFANCPRGLENLLAVELETLGAASIETIIGGISFQGDWSLGYRANLESRLATRILWQVAKSNYRSEDDIYHLAYQQPWGDYFSLSQTFRVSVNAIHCPLRSLDFVTLRVKDAVCDHFRQKSDERPNIDTRHPDVGIHVFLSENDCTIYLDTSGTPLWQRGLRKESVLAPLKENLAAGILQLTGWQPGMALVDPMCGSGTFLLEAAQMVLDRAPGLDRGFAFERLKCFEASNWHAIRNAAETRVKNSDEPPLLFGFDKDIKAVHASQKNFEAAGFSGIANIQHGNVLDLRPPAESGLMVANPPYGERVGELDELADFYPQLGSTLKKHWAGWTCFFFSGDDRLPKGVGLKPSKKTPLQNGALSCRLYSFKMVAGSNRQQK